MVLRPESGMRVLMTTDAVGGVWSYCLGLTGTLQELAHPNRKVVFWDVDAPATLERVQEHEDDPFRPLIPAYDLILTYGGGEPVVRAYRQLGAGRCVPIYNALSPSTHYPVAKAYRFEADLGFCGNRMPDREARVAKALEVLSREQAQQIGELARQRVLAEHTYAQRAAQVERCLSENPCVWGLMLSHD